MHRMGPGWVATVECLLLPAKPPERCIALGLTSQRNLLCCTACEIVCAIVQNIQWIKINNMTTQIPSLNPYGNANTGSDCVGSGGGFHLVPWYLQTPTVGRENSVPLTCP